VVIVCDNLQKEEQVKKEPEIVFYKRENGKVPVRDFLFSLPVKLRSKSLRDIELLKQYGSELKEPYVKPIKGKKNKGLYELRIKYGHDIARIFYFMHINNRYVLLHGFIKKTLKTPEREIEKALSYMEDYIRRN